MDDPMYEDYTQIQDLPNYEVQELEWFFEDYQDIMRREVNVDGFLGAERACEVVVSCRKRYQSEFEKT